MKKRLLSVTAILVLCLALLSVTALAADTEGYGVTVNDVAVTSANESNVLTDENNTGKVSYNADTNTLTINGGLTNAGSSTATVISGNGATNIVINGVDISPAAFGLTVTDAKNVTVTANSGSPAINGATDITCSGDVKITNIGNGLAVAGTLTVNGAQNVTVTANSGGSAINGATDITCSGDVKITNIGNGLAVADTLTVDGARNVTVTANSNSPALLNGANINCSGDVEITNEGRNDAVSGSLVVSGAQNVTVTANSSNAAISTRASIDCSGNVEITNTNQDGWYAVRELTVTGAHDVTVTANNSHTAISRNSDTNVSANITCSGDVSITNSGTGSAVDGTLTVNGAQNVTVTANSGGSAINGATDITCSGDVKITNIGNGLAVADTLTVNDAQNVTVTANSSSYAINNGADINCSGNVEIVNKGDDNATAVQGTLTVNHAQDVTVTANSNQAVSQTLTVNDAQNVTVTANNSSAAINDVDITCSGNVEIVNEGGGMAVGFTLTFQQSNGHSYTVKTGNDLESLTIYAEKAAGETFNVESLNVSAVKIESAGHTPGEWEYNSTQHWRFCTVCEAELDRADHSGSICTVCGYTKPSSGGSYTPTYSITAPKTEHGSVTVSPGYAERGDTVTVAVKPDKGYTLETLTVTDKNGNEIELTDKGDGKYTFKMPGSKVTVKATFMEDNSMLNFFVDVFPGDYYYDAVLWAAENGITGGVNDVHFAPNAPCTRAQIVTFLWRAAGCPEPENLSSFADVSADSYYAKAVAWAVENGITGGTGSGMFSPDATCTRAQAMTFIWRSQKSVATDGVNPFTDVAADAYYADAVMWAVANGITNGASDTTFSPNNDCTRAQIVTFLYRFFVK